MKKRLTALLLAVSLPLSGCALRAAVQESRPPEGAYEIYFAVADDAPGNQVVGFEYRVPPGGSVIPGLVSLLLAGPDSPKLKSPFQGKTVTLLSSTLEEGQLTLDLSEQYGGLTGIDLTIASYCFALTLCQAPGVESVRLTVDGEPLAPVLTSQQLRAEDVLFSGSEDIPVQLSAILWYPISGGDGLALEEVTLTRTEEETAAQVVLDALLKGPSSPALLSPFPPGTEILSVRVEDSICSVDFSSPFRAGLPDDPVRAKLLLYAVVNTLTSSIDTVEAVQIRVAGEPIPFFGDIPAANPVEHDYSLESQLTKS